MRLSGLTKFRISNSGAGSGNATASDLLSGKTASTDVGDIVGTMPNKVGSGTVITPGTADIAIPQGYFGGVLTDGKVVGDANLIAANILSGKSIFGVAGSVIPRKYASGSQISVNTGGGIYDASGGGVTGGYRLTVSGLTFKPNILLIVMPTSPYEISIWSDHYPQILTTNALDSILVFTSAPGYVVYRLDGTTMKVTSTDFTMPVNQFNVSYNWYAYAM